MPRERGFERIARTVRKFLEEHGYRVHIGAWVDIMIGNRLVFDFQIGHWSHHRPPKRGVPCALYVTTEGRVKPEARRWLKGYDYVFCQSNFVRRMLQEIDVDCIVMPVGIDVEHFKPLPIPKWIDVLSIGIWESSWDNRKFMDMVTRVAFPYSHYVHTRPTLRYEDMPWLYNSARVYVSLSGCEGVNIPVIEANACGVPVVYNDACATGEYAYGIAVPPKRVYEIEDRGILFLIHEPNIEEIRRRVHELLGNPSRLESMSREARIHALKFDYRRTYRPLLEVLPKP